jgi:hypothetical protein
MGKSYGPCRIFWPAFTCLDFPNMAISYAKPYVAAPGAGKDGQAHGGTGLAPRHNAYAVLMRLSRIGQHIKEEPCAKQRAFLEVSDLWGHFLVLHL